MYYVWLGILAGVVALGVVVLMGLTIFHGKTLVMQRENWELARILIPSIVSILGWLVTIWWALRQVEISSQKNRNLQYEMLQSSERIKVVYSVISTYIEINKSFHKIQRYINNFKANIELKKEGKNNPDLASIFHKSGNAYSEMFENIESLKFSLARLPPYGVDNQEGIDFIKKTFECFSGKFIWYTYQVKAAEYLQNEEGSIEELFYSIDKISDNCNEMCSTALTVVMQLNTPTNS